MAKRQSNICLLFDEKCDIIPIKKSTRDGADLPPDLAFKKGGEMYDNIRNSRLVARDDKCSCCNCYVGHYDSLLFPKEKEEIKKSSPVCQRERSVLK